MRADIGKVEEKLFYQDIQKMLNGGYIEKIKRGYYAWVEASTKTEVRIIKDMFLDAEGRRFDGSGCLLNCKHGTFY